MPILPQTGFETIMRTSLTSAGIPGSMVQARSGATRNLAHDLFTAVYEIALPAWDASIQSGTWFSSLIPGPEIPTVFPGPYTVTPIGWAAAVALASFETLPPAALIDATVAGWLGPSGIFIPLAVRQSAFNGAMQSPVNLQVASATMGLYASSFWKLTPSPISVDALIPGLMAKWSADPDLATTDPASRLKLARALLTGVTSVFSAIQPTISAVNPASVLPPPPAQTPSLLTTTIIV